MPDDEDMFDDLMKAFPDMSADEKLRLLRHESLMYLNHIAGYAGLLGNIDTAETKSLPEEFSVWIQRLDEKMNGLREALDRYTL